MVETCSLWTMTARCGRRKYTTTIASSSWRSSTIPLVILPCGCPAVSWCLSTSLTPALDRSQASREAQRPRELNTTARDESCQEPLLMAKPGVTRIWIRWGLFLQLFVDTEDMLKYRTECHYHCISIQQSTFLVRSKTYLYYKDLCSCREFRNSLWIMWVVYGLGDLGSTERGEREFCGCFCEVNGLVSSNKDPVTVSKWDHREKSGFEFRQWCHEDKK